MQRVLLALVLQRAVLQGTASYQDGAEGWVKSENYENVPGVAQKPIKKTKIFINIPFMARSSSTFGG